MKCYKEKVCRRNGEVGVFEKACSGAQYYDISVFLFLVYWLLFVYLARYSFLLLFDEIWNLIGLIVCSFYVHICRFVRRALSTKIFSSILHGLLLSTCVLFEARNDEINFYPFRRLVYLYVERKMRGKRRNRKAVDENINLHSVPPYIYKTNLKHCTSRYTKLRFYTRLFVVVISIHTQQLVKNRHSRLFNFTLFTKCETFCRFICIRTNQLARFTNVYFFIALALVFEIRKVFVCVLLCRR